MKHVIGYVLLCVPLFKFIYGSYLYAGLDPRQTRARFRLRVGALVAVPRGAEHAGLAPRLVLEVNEPVGEDAVALVHPEREQVELAVQHLADGALEDALEDP